ncbi:hypothetical protein [Streptomyces antioxidans]|uniref:hypothetical protein n=1 Tax=Streptomyces antioxidans TaxID=1507734 RepID=UPI00117C06A6|nr:hypothetical protein [Streptomyces antioxidans]
MRNAIDPMDPLRSVHALKQTVINELKETDSRVSIKSTDYFNHTFAPDLVLRWPHDSNVRRLFLRTDPDPIYLAQDMGIAGAPDSIFFSLSSGERPGEVGSDESLHAAALEAGALLTDADGLQEFIESRRETPVVSLASSAILQGGRGLIKRPEAVAVSRGVSDGFSAAQELDVSRTRSATRVINEVFDGVRSSRLTRFLQAVWVGSGGDAATFPAPADVAGPLDDEALSFLLDLEEITDDSFWRRIGRGITLDRLAGLTINQPSRNLQRLVTNNLDVLQAKICRIALLQPQLWRDESPLQWAVDREMLALQSDRFAAFLAGRREDLNARPEDLDGISVNDVVKRAVRHRIAVSELELSTVRRTLTYGSDRVEDVTRDEELADFAEVLGPSVRVNAAIASIARGRNLRCDFTSLTGQGRTAAKFPISELLYAALGLMMELTEEEERQLSVLLSGGATTDSDDEYSLFGPDDIP